MNKTYPSTYACIGLVKKLMPLDLNSHFLFSFSSLTCWYSCGSSRKWPQYSQQKTTIFIRYGKEEQKHIRYNLFKTPPPTTITSKNRLFTVYHTQGFEPVAFYVNPLCSLSSTPTVHFLFIGRCLNITVGSIKLKDGRVFS